MCWYTWRKLSTLWITRRSYTQQWTEYLDCQTLFYKKFCLSFPPNKLFNPPYCLRDGNISPLQSQSWNLIHSIGISKVAILIFWKKPLRSLSVKKFTLTDGMDIPKSVSRLDRWMSFAVKSDVEELNLTFVRGWDRRYQLPQSVFLAKSLTVFDSKLVQVALNLWWYKLKLTLFEKTVFIWGLYRWSNYS